MSKVNSTYTISLRDQKTPVESYQWRVDDVFFAHMEDAEIQHGEVDVLLDVERLVGGAYELRFDLKGRVKVACDRCLEPMCQDLEGSASLRVKLGEEDADDGELITIPEDRGTLDLQWNIYEMIALQLPLRHVHPEGECSQQAEEALNKLTAHEDKADTEEATAIDPRWNALKEILNNNK